MPIQTCSVRVQHGGGSWDAGRPVNRLLIVLAFCTGCSAVLAEDVPVYKWVDENGTVHYGDRPKDTDAEKLELDAAPAPDDALSARRAKQEKLLRIMEEERQRESDKAVQAKAEQEQQKQMCATAKERLSQYENSRYLFEEDKDGNRRRLSYEERQQLEDNARTAIARYCK
ncbi:MAG: DUF4124 domain-containing protein [Gammaproteobacteria bacterium]|nr:DUF4124 domain-containing protein [Gammaproteobacteria bacterium]MCI0590863.1 DUF4124 domain-containing protein [Gammaproteobacteria bacterium]